MNPTSMIQAVTLLMSFALGYGSGWIISSNLNGWTEIYHSIQETALHSLGSTGGAKQAGEARVGTVSQTQTKTEVTHDPVGKYSGARQAAGETQRQAAGSSQVNHSHLVASTDQPRHGNEEPSGEPGKAEQQLNQLENDRSLEQNLRNVEAELIQQQNVIKTLEETRKSRDNQALQQYTQQSVQIERQALEQENEANQLQNQLAQARSYLEVLNHRIQQLSSIGVETDQLRELVRQHRVAQTQFQQLQSQYSAYRVQAGQAAFIAKNIKDKEHQETEEAIHEEYETQLKEATQRYQQLQAESQNLRKKLDEKHAKIENLSAKLDGDA
jgi:predicted RNase H-like nuclease (RuvC/YqgF family)